MKYLKKYNESIRDKMKGPPLDEIKKKINKLSDSDKIKDNRNIGEWKYFYPTGELESIGNFDSDYPHGKWVWYYYNGNIKETGTYINGKKTGTWYIYNNEGRILSIKMYDEDEQINEIIFDRNTNV